MDARKAEKYLTGMIRLALECILLFLAGTFLFDCVHYLLHVFENSRFRLLRMVGGLHAVHHEFLDRNMKLQRQFGMRNLILHVIPEYGTAVVGTALLSHFLFNWTAGGIVIAIRTVMLIVYLEQKGEDFTHAETERIASNRSLIWVGPNYHALHHVYPRQHYSSFVNIFDMIFGTNCQIRERRFLFVGDPKIQSKLAKALEKRGAIVEYGLEREKLERADVLVLKLESEMDADLVDLFRDIGRARLVPPEVWGMGSAALARRFYRDENVTYRHFSNAPEKAFQVAMGLFFVRRGFCYIPTQAGLGFPWGYFQFLRIPPAPKAQVVRSAP